MKVKRLLIFLLISVFAFLVGRYSNNFEFLNKNVDPKSNVSKFEGKLYSISYPTDWDFEGPSEGPITGFPEYSKLISPSKDTQIVIGLKGDNRFEYVYDDIHQKTLPSEVIIGDKKYVAEEQYFDFDENPEFNIVILESELDDAYMIGQSGSSKELFLPIKIQILYRFSNENIPFESKMEMYKAEKAQALEIIKTFKFYKNQ